MADVRRSISILGVMGAIACSGGEKWGDSGYGGTSYSWSDSGGSSAEEACATETELMVGEWITKGDTTSSSTYNTLSFTADGRGSLFMYDSGYTLSETYDWWIDGSSCENLRIVYDSIQNDPYDEWSIIEELNNPQLIIEATDGSQLGARTEYDRVSGGIYGSDFCDWTLVLDGAVPSAEALDQVEATVTDASGATFTVTATSASPQSETASVAPGPLSYVIVETLNSDYTWEDTGSRTRSTNYRWACDGYGGEQGHTVTYLE